ncbi:MAG: acyl-CoA/acyl-ACP dehydrogenase [Candidatus Eremiobacteraeota bacterium]|nr:acyl-CoA/acyl-ACP dehydrogenase [Candidatus Eremiobacteraeota bacterium]
MDFDLNEDQVMIRDMVARMAEETILPLAEEIDNTAVIPDEITGMLAELNLFGIFGDEDVGGAGLDLISYLLIMEEIGSASGSLGIILAYHNSLGVLPLLKSGKKDILPSLCSGEKLISFGHLEHETDYSSAPRNTIAMADDGNYTVTGEKLLVPSPPKTGYYIITARFEDKPAIFLVEAESPGLSRSEPVETIGGRGVDFRDLKLENVKSNLLCKGEEAENLFGLMVAHCSLALSAVSCGIMKRCLKDSISYAQQRVQFGSPIIDFPLVQNHLTEIARLLETSRQLVLRASAGEITGPSPRVSLARWHSSTSATDCGLRAIQIHGGYGYSREYPLERYLRDIQTINPLVGSEEIHRNIIFQYLNKGGVL